MTVSRVDHRGADTLKICAVFTSLAGLFVLLRLYTRIFILRRPGLEDYTIVLALLFFIGYTVGVGIHVQHGMGYHIWQLSPGDAEWTYKAHWATVIMFAAAVPVTKVSIFIQYLRVFTSERCRRFSWGAIIFLILFAISNTIAAILACIPVKASWTRQPAKCMNACAGYLFNCAINIITDLACLIFPILVIKSLNLPRRQRAALMSIFALGGVACVIGVIRIHAILIMCDLTDPPYNDPLSAILAAIEIGVSIVCACLPLLRPLFTRIFPSFFESSDCGTKSTLNTCITIGEIRTRGIHRSNDDDLLSSKRASHIVDQVAAQEFRTISEAHAQFLKDQAAQNNRLSGRFTQRNVRLGAEPKSSSTEILVQDPRQTE